MIRCVVCGMRVRGANHSAHCVARSSIHPLMVRMRKRLIAAAEAECKRVIALKLAARQAAEAEAAAAGYGYDRPVAVDRQFLADRIRQG